MFLREAANTDLKLLNLKIYSDFKLTPHASLLSWGHEEQTSEDRQYVAPLTYGISPSTGFVPKQPTPTAAGDSGSVLHDINNQLKNDL